MSTVSTPCIMMHHDGAFHTGSAGGSAWILSQAQAEPLVWTPCCSDQKFQDYTQNLSRIVFTLDAQVKLSSDSAQKFRSRAPTAEPVWNAPKCSDVDVSSRVISLAGVILCISDAIEMHKRCFDLVTLTFDIQIWPRYPPTWAFCPNSGPCVCLFICKSKTVAVSRG